MAASWGTTTAGTQLSLSGSYQTMQESTVDWEIGLAPNEIAQVQFNYSRASTPTEDCQIAIVSSPDDGTTYDGDDVPYLMVWLDEDDADANGDVIKTVLVSHVEQFKIRARLRDDDDTAGGGDTGATLDAKVRKGTLA